MESFIVRVCRRDRNDPDEVAGLVETVGTEEKEAFQSFSGLVTAIRHALGEDDMGVGVETQAHLYTDEETGIKNNSLVRKTFQSKEMVK
ncbi:MAG: hypothetical protein ABFS22_00740 [Pseudomonadota bacterium]